MPLPTGFPTFNEPQPQRRPPPDYTQRGTKLRLFAWLAAIMFVLAVVERGRDPAAWEWLHSPPVPANRTKPQPVQAKRQPSEAASAVVTPDLAEILDRYGIGSSELASLVDGQPLTANEESLLAKVLDRFPRLGLDNLYRWRQQELGWDQLASQSGDHRAKVFHVCGRVQRVEKISLSADQAELYEFEHYSRVTLALADSQSTAIVFTRHVPAAWQLDQTLNEPAEADALFLKLGEAEASLPKLLFAADRIAWLPDKLDPAHGVGPAQLALAKLGMDVSLWDDVRDLNHRPLGAGDREAFYQVLAALGQPAFGELGSTSGDWLDLGPLLQQPQKHHGDVLPVAGTARRISRIEVPDADVRARFGIDHYYEIDLFIPLGKARIRLGEGQSDDQQPEFRNTFPATLIVRQLPPGLTAKNNLHEQIQADAVFFKVWTYDSRYTARFGQVQPAPLFVAFEPRVIAASANTDWLSAALVSTALGFSLAVLMLVLWWSFRPGKRRRLSSTVAPPPDFSRLR
jgi:hypothetical protein